jgi:hypothetical protein
VYAPPPPAAPLLKPVRLVDEPYLDHIRAMRCLVHGRGCSGRVDPAHLKTRGSGGSDYTAVPLCRLHHTEQEGRTAAFNAKYGVDLWREAHRLAVEWLLNKLAA